MSKRRGKSTTTVGELAILASSVGLVEKSEQGRQAYCAWYADDQKAARAELFKRVAARRVQASAAKAAAAGTRTASAAAQPTAYPSSWARGTGGLAAGAAAKVRRAKGGTASPAVVARSYPAGWLPAAGVAGRQHDAVRIVEVND